MLSRGECRAEEEEPELVSKLSRLPTYLCNGCPKRRQTQESEKNAVPAFQRYTLKRSRGKKIGN